MEWQKTKEQIFLEFLVEQEQKIKYKGLEEQEEFMKFREKQMRVLQIKGFVQKTHKIKVQHQIGEMLKDMEPPNGMLKIDLENFRKNHDIDGKPKRKKVEHSDLVID